MTTQVAVGVILRDSEVFIALRPRNKHKGGFWEFPGGKIKSGETTVEALQRELAEEIGISFTQAEPFMGITWSYPEQKVFLDVMTVREFSGEPTGNEGQQVQWVEIADLKGYQFPEANTLIVNRLMKCI